MESSSEDEVEDEGDGNDASSGGALIALNAENRLINVENNAVVDRFQDRLFTGLEPGIPLDITTDIKMDMFGTAMGYQPLVKNVSPPEAPLDPTKCS